MPKTLPFVLIHECIREFCFFTLIYDILSKFPNYLQYFNCYKKYKVKTSYPQVAFMGEEQA